MKKFKKLMAGFAVVVTLLTTISGAHALVAIDTSTRKWEKGVGTTLYVYYWQYSNYWHKTKRHYANAMMNDKYSGRVYANKISGQKLLHQDHGEDILQIIHIMVMSS